MAKQPIGPVVAGCLTAGLIGAVALVLGPIAGAEEYVTTGSLLLVFGASWGLVAILSVLWTNQPQRWAALPAGFMVSAGAGLLVCAPSGDDLNRLGWVWPALWLATCAWAAVRARRQLRSWSGPWLVYPLLGVWALCGIGGAYQTMGESFDRRVSAPGQLIDVGGHRLHVTCAGTGSPTVVLESGLGETGAYWGWISAALAGETTVCAYDRAGRGWSDPPAHAQDGAAVAADLHALLERRHVPGPLVLVGHSSGAQYVRIFARRYPAQVGGMVLLDGQPVEAFESLPIFPAFYAAFRRVSGLLPSLARLGVGRLVFHDSFGELPPGVRDQERRSHSSARFFRSLRDEFAALPASLREARALESLGNRPLVVVTASRDAQEGWLPLQDRMAMLSANSIHRVLPYSHDALVTDRAAAQASSQSVRDVVHAVRFSVPLAQ